MTISTYQGKVKKIVDLSPTAREITFLLDTPMAFKPGSFVNVFTDVNGEKVRRAYSLSSNPRNANEISLSIRRAQQGTVSPVFWHDDIHDKKFMFMGPLGVNTSDKMVHENIFLFAYGIGISVIKSILFDVLERDNVKNVTLVTGNRDESELLYREYLDSLASDHPKLTVRYVLSESTDNTYPYQGYIQNNIADLDFTASDAYICGPTKACESLIETIEKKHPADCAIHVEKFG